MNGPDSDRQEWTEGIGTILSSQNFSLVEYPVNPGDPTFVRLANTALNWQYYHHDSFLASTKSNASTARTDSSTIGQVSIYPRYNVEDPLPTSMLEVLNMSESVTQDGFRDIRCPVNCRKQALKQYPIYHSSGTLPVDDVINRPFSIVVVTWGWPADGDEIAYLILSGKISLFGRRSDRSGTNARFATIVDAPTLYTPAVADPIMTNTMSTTHQSPSSFISFTADTVSGVSTNKIHFNYPGYYFLQFDMGSAAAGSISDTVLTLGTVGDAVSYVGYFPNAFNGHSGIPTGRVASTGYTPTCTYDICRIWQIIHVTDASDASSNWIHPPVVTTWATPALIEHSQLVVLQVPSAFALLTMRPPLADPAAVVLLQNRLERLERILADSKEFSILPVEKRRWFGPFSVGSRTYTFVGTTYMVYDSKNDSQDYVSLPEFYRVASANGITRHLPQMHQLEAYVSALKTGVEAKPPLDPA